jgi:hypothetical protein
VVKVNREVLRGPTKQADASAHNIRFDIIIRAGDESERSLTHICSARDIPRPPMTQRYRMDGEVRGVLRSERVWKGNMSRAMHSANGEHRWDH